VYFGNPVALILLIFCGIFFLFGRGDFWPRQYLHNKERSEMKRLLVVASLVLALPTFAQQPTEGFFSPIKKTLLVDHKSNFGAMSTDYPIQGVWHCGDDLFCPLGSDVFAISDGVVIYNSVSGWDEQETDVEWKRENYAPVLLHMTNNGIKFVAIYGHLKRPADPNDPTRPMSDVQIRNYRLGEKIQAGSVIGQIGRWPKPHLHFGIYCNLEDLNDFPKANLGRQPLPRPAAEYYQGVLHYANWHEPLAWLKAFLPGRIAGPVLAESYSPLGSWDNETIFFVRNSSDGERIIMNDHSGKAEVSHWLITRGKQFLKMANAPENSLIIEAKDTDGEYILYRVWPGNRFSTLVVNNSEIGFGDPKENVGYFPVKTAMTWQAWDFEKGQLVSRKEIFGEPGALDDLGFGARPWRLLGQELDLNSGRTRLVCWTVNARNQYRNWISGSKEESDHDGLVVLRTSKENDPEGSKRVVFSIKEDHWTLYGGLLEPNEEPLLHGFRLTKVWRLVKSDDDIISSSRIDFGNQEYVLLTTTVDGIRHLGRCDIFGGGLQIFH